MFIYLQTWSLPIDLDFGVVLAVAYQVIAMETIPIPIPSTQPSLLDFQSALELGMVVIFLILLTVPIDVSVYVLFSLI